MKEFRGEDWEGKDCELPSTVTWEMIADKVQTRNSSQCRTKWLVGIMLHIMNDVVIYYYNIRAQ
jgi:hypothetical protein